MLLTLTTTHRPATDLGYLLHKHPDKLQSFKLNFGTARVFYPEANAERCTAALLVDLDPITLVRGKQALLQDYVNDRPYAASSLLSVALAQVFGSALAGRCKERGELAQRAMPLRAHLPVVPCHGSEALLHELFEPLGYRLTLEHRPLDPQFPVWGDSRYFALTLEAECRLRDLLNHLYVLIPVLDNDKHYWVGDDEVDKLLRHGGAWLAEHPQKERISARYLKHRRSLVRDALARLSEDAPPDDAAQDQAEALAEKPLSLDEQRLGSVLAVLKSRRAQRILDLGCGEGRLLKTLLKDSDAAEILGVDISPAALERAADRLRLERLPPMQQARVKLIQGSLTYRDRRLSGYDAAAVLEVVEHLEADRLDAFTRTVFQYAAPASVIVTTPNREYNVLFENLPAGKLRHADHRFEWTRAEFEAWAGDTARHFEYKVSFLPVGEVHPQYGPPTQMAVFDRV